MLGFLNEDRPDLVLLEEVDRRWLEELEPLRPTHPLVVASPRRDNFGIPLFSNRPFRSSRVVELGSTAVPATRPHLWVPIDHC